MLHIMVVDDEAPIRDWLVYCIQKCEAASSVTSAVNGEEAYRRILEQKPNVVFTDIRMPGMDGLELMSKVRDILPFTVFIILTNYAEFSYAKQAISLGAREYILKSEMRSSDIQRIVAEIAATTAKIRSEKVHDVLQDGVVDLYEMYRNFEQPGAVAAFWQRQGLRPGQPYLAFCVANDSSLDLRRQMVALASASRAPFSAAAMVQEHLYLLLQCPEAEALRGYALDTEAALAPSDMMDGRVAAIRAVLDEHGYETTPIMAYSAKYASAFYGPFRAAAGSTPSFGDRKGYQMDPHNRKEALKECALDEAEGADILMVKPALSYLDVIRECSDAFDLPMCAYSVSGEYAMIKAAGAAGLVDEYRIMCESALSVFRAGANMLITYYAKELAQAIQKGDIG